MYKDWVTTLRFSTGSGFLLCDSAQNFTPEAQLSLTYFLTNFGPLSIDLKSG